MRDPGTDSVPAVVLAAGGSVRMGRPKAFLPLNTDETFLSRIACTLDRAGAAPLVVVGAPEWTGRPAGLPEYTQVVINPAPDLGQLSSLQCGLAVLPAASSAVLFTLVDVPFITVETVLALVSTAGRVGADIVRPERSGRHGHPVLVTRVVAAALLSAESSQTTRAVLRAFAASTVDVPVEDEGAFVDVDTPEEYERVMRAQHSSPFLVRPT